jgi:multiple sugar transport system permease protein
MSVQAAERRAPRHAPRRRTQRARRRREALMAYAFIAPNLVVFAAFMFLPLVLVFYYAMTQKSGFRPEHYVGFSNYRELISDHTFYRSLANTAVYALVMVPLTVGGGLGLAVLLNGRVWGRTLWRSILFLPVVLSGLAIGIMGAWIFDEQVGVANKIVSYVGLGPYHWQSNPTLAVITVLLVSTWSYVGLPMVIYLAALQGVPRELYDAAASDGATPRQQFRYITVPGVRFATGFQIIYSIITSFQVFDLVYALTSGGPGDATNVLGLYAYTTAFASRREGYGAAVGVVLYLIILLITVAQWRFTTRDETR